MAVRIHPSADVSPAAEIGDGTQVWHNCQVREHARLGRSCILGKGVYIDEGVSIGDNVKIQNYVSVFQGVTIEDGVFVGPHVCFTNDLQPRAIRPDGALKTAQDWTLTETRLRRGAALGANCTIICGITIGEWAMVGAGSVVSRDIPDYGLAWGSPARLHGFVCPCGQRLEWAGAAEPGQVLTRCPKCARQISIPLENWEKIT